MLLTLLATLTFSFHLPTVDMIADSTGCRDGFAPNTDLESCYVWQQAQHWPPRILWRTRQAGQQGALKSFTDQDTFDTAIYWVETSDMTGNRIRLGAECGPKVLQWARTTSVPGPMATPTVPRRLYDLAGRLESRAVFDEGINRWKCPVPGVYFERTGNRRGKLVIIKP